MKVYSRRLLLKAGAGLVGLALVAGCSSESANEASTPAPAASAPAYALLSVPAGKPGPVDFAAQLGAARTAGQIQDVVLLKSKPSVEGPVGFDSLAVVQFKDEASWSDWNRDSAKKLGENVSIKRADLIVDRRATADAPNPAYVVNHYGSLVSQDQYRSYTEDYIAPNMEGQKAKGVMNGYAMYYEREPAGTNSKAVLVKEYVDHAGFERSLTLKDIKENLMKNPEWKRINDTKDKIRTDISSTLATPVPVP